MSSYNPAVPQPSDILSDSQQDFLNNFTQLDTSFGIDHYTFSNGTADNGKHNQVTTPIISGSAHPTTSATENKFYAMQDSSNAGLIQYSRGISNATPTPVTKRQSSGVINLNSGTTTDILDFTGLTRAIGTVFFGSMSSPALSADIFSLTFLWTGSAFTFGAQITNPNLSTFNIVNTLNKLQLKNITAGSVNNVYWTLELHRMQ